MNGKAKYKNFIFGCILLTISCVIAFCFGELFVRFFYKKNVPILPRFVSEATYGDFKIWKNTPGKHYQHRTVDGSWQYRINEQGFRDDHAYTHKKENGVKRVLVIGDSYAVGIEVGQDETFSNVLEEELVKMGQNVEVYNTGVSGFSSAEELIFLKNEGIKYDPDVIVWCFYGNDYGENVRANLYQLKNGKLVLHQSTFLPAIAIKRVLQALPLYDWLREHSYLHNFLNLSVSKLLKSKKIKENEKELNQVGNRTEIDGYRMALAQEILREGYRFSKSQQIPFILLEIPGRGGILNYPSLEDPRQLSDHYLSGELLLGGPSARESFYRPHGQNHWNEVGHKKVGIELANIIGAVFKEAK